MENRAGKAQDATRHVQAKRNIHAAQINEGARRAQNTKARRKTKSVKTPAPPAPIDFVEAMQGQRKQRRRQRLTWLIVIALLCTGYVSGFFAKSATMFATLQESAQITFVKQAGFPASTGLSEVYQAQALADGFVVLGKESCAVYSAGGNRLVSFQSGYARPAIAVGSNRYVLYNRSGKELRVESRTKTLYTKTMSNNILLCAMSENGYLAVVTENERYCAQLTVYSPTMQELTKCFMTDAQGMPLHIAFSPNEKQLAVTTVAVQNGVLCSNVYMLARSSDVLTQITQMEQRTPQAVQWVSSSAFVVVYDDAIVQYDAKTATKTEEISFAGDVLTGMSFTENKIALLFDDRTEAHFWIINKSFDVLTGQAPDALSVLLADDALYVRTQLAVQAYAYDMKKHEVIAAGTAAFDAPIQAIARAKEVLVFTGHEVTELILEEP